MPKFSFSIDTIDQLIKKIESSSINKIKVACNEFEIIIEKQSMNTNDQIVVRSKNTQNPVFSTNSDISSKINQEQIKGNVVKSPIVGTFYDAPAPNKPPFVNIGDKIKKGDVIYIVESMKLMNEVKSEFDGTLKKIMVHSGDNIEYGQPIMIIE